MGKHMKPEPENTELLTLLDLDGLSHWYDNGYWVKLEAIRAMALSVTPGYMRYILLLLSIFNDILLMINAPINASIRLKGTENHNMPFGKTFKFHMTSHIMKNDGNQERSVV